MTGPARQGEMGVMRALGGLALAALLWLAAATAAAVPSDADDPVWTPAERVRIGRYTLETGRALSAEGRPEAAERSFRRGLAVQPENPLLLRALARLIDAQGRREEAQALRARADQLDPPPDLLPTGAAFPSRGLLVVLVPPDPPRAPGLVDAPRDWPLGGIASALEARVQERLPEATLVHADPIRVGDAQSWLPEMAPRAALSLQVGRVDCGWSVKDGPFGVAHLRAAAAAPGDEAPATEWIRVVLLEPRHGEHCQEEMLARALEAVLEHPELRPPLASSAAAGVRYGVPSIRALFPGLERRVRSEIDRGRTLLKNGDLLAAEKAFEQAISIDPEATLARAYLDEAQRSLRLARELAGDDAAAEAGRVAPRLSSAQREAAERALEEERRRREDLLAALAVLEEDVELPRASVLESLRRVRIPDPPSYGTELVRARADGEIEARGAFAPDGSLLARYYYAVGAPLPLLREEDTNGDGRADRWIAYEGSARREVWEDRYGRGTPDLHLVFAPGGTPLARIEVDVTGDGEPDRVFRYRQGVLVAEALDTDGDGVLDRFDRLDEEGRVAQREEDLDGDGRIDVRSVYHDESPGPAAHAPDPS